MGNAKLELLYVFVACYPISDDNCYTRSPARAPSSGTFYYYTMLLFLLSPVIHCSVIFTPSSLASFASEASICATSGAPDKDTTAVMSKTSVALRCEGDRAASLSP